MAAIWLIFTCFFVAVTAQDFAALNNKIQQVNAYRDLSLDDIRRVESAFDGMRDFWYQNMKSLLLEASEFGNQSRNLSAECMAGSAKLFEAKDPVTGLPLMVRMIDAMGKIGPGFMEGNVYASGAYDECFDIGPGDTEYCIGDVSLEVPVKLPVSLTWKFGMCVPRGCTPEDVAYAVGVVTFGIAESNVSTVSCVSTKRPPFNAGAIIMIIVSFIFVILVVAATVTDFILCREAVSLSGQIQDNPEKTPLVNKGSSATKSTKVEEIITAFSLFKVLPQILLMKQPPSAITSVNGLRVISMFWVILGHTHLFSLITGVDNFTHLRSTLSRFSFQSIGNGFFAVDTFFVLSGLLVAYLSMRQMKRKNGRFPFLTYYLHRYLRLTPTYAFVLFFMWLLTMHLADGQIYYLLTWEDSAIYQNCKKYWWTNLLYINNFYPWRLNDECVDWSWYLANDMQFYIFSPLILIPLYFLFPLGLVISAGVIFVSFVISGTLAGVYDHQANHFPDLAYNYKSNISLDKNQDNLLYIKPWHRVAPYIVGLMLGYVLYRFQRVPNKRHIVTYIVFPVIWILSGIILFSTVYGLYFTWHGHIPTKAENVIYITFSRFAWSLGLALIVFACHYGYGGPINWFLSMKLWIPLSRISYNAYLLHPFILMVIFGSNRKIMNYQDYNFVIYAIGITVLSYGAAAVVSVFVEFPIGNLEQVLFKMAGLGRHESARTGGGEDHDSQAGSHIPRNEQKEESGPALTAKPLHYSEKDTV